MTYDTIIIGSGLGGLVAGAKLAKEGRSVLLVEQHSSTGGYATCFTQNNFTIDAGFHSMDGLYIQDPKIKVFEDLDVYLNIEFLKIPTGYLRFTNERIDFRLPDTIEKATKALIQQFPKEEKGIVSFFKILKNVSSSKWKDKTAGDMLDSLFNNDDIKLILTGTIQYYGDDPYTVSALAFATALSRNFEGGNHYIRGGSMKLTDYFANLIKEHGGKTVLNKKVTKIHLDAFETVTGVEYVSTKNDETITTQVDAKNVILNASVPQAAFELLPENETTIMLRESVKHMKLGHSVLNIYLGFNTTLEKLGHIDYLTVVNDKSVIRLSDIFSNNNGGYSRKNFLFIDYGQIESGMAPFGKSTGVISTVDYIENWDKLSKEEYATKKKEVETVFIERLNKLIPDVKSHIEYVSVATPMTMKRYTLNPKGSTIGFARTPPQVGMYPLKSPIKNLYFSSTWSIPDGGFTSIITAGWNSAVAILRKRR
ncbi:MAG: NAD(P)/FAD-dependent oxidoreductase [Candidatus Heimdallarchaeota archaeon]|nr:NAD(P)/FAD-dependent oxidoreductase [Candidatus Heimdallarchaeota archaeon]